MSTALKMTGTKTSFVAETEVLSAGVGKHATQPLFDLSDGDLVAGYRQYNALEKAVGGVRKTLRDLVESRIKARCEADEVTGALTVLDEDEAIYGDEKGHIHFEVPEGHLELRPRVKTEFLEDEAREILESRGLLPLAIDREVVVTDQAALLSVLNEVQEYLVQRGETTMAQKVEATYRGATETRETISQAKIKELVRRKKLLVSDVEAMFDTKVSYSLYDKS